MCGRPSASRTGSSRNIAGSVGDKPDPRVSSDSRTVTTPSVGGSNSREENGTSVNEDSLAASFRVDSMANSTNIQRIDETDEIDPVLTELDAAIDQAQMLHLLAQEDSILDVEWKAHCAAHSEESTTMSAEDFQGPGNGTCNMEPAVATATKRQKNAFDRFVKKLGQKAHEREARAAVVAAAQDDILSLREHSKTIGTQAGHLDESPWEAVGNGSEQSTGIDTPSWWERRQNRCSEFEGLGYGAKFSQYAFAKAAAPMQAPDRSHSERREIRRQSRMQEGGESFLAFEAFEKCCAANGMTPMSSGGGTSEVDHDVAAALLTSKNLSPEGFSAVDSGTTLTIMDLPEDMFVDFAKSRSTKIMGFDGNVTRSRGGGTVIGYAMSSEGRRVELRMPQVHSVQGAPHDLLSVSGLVLLGYEFHFTQARSYVVTPELEILDLLQKGGLYWLSQEIHLSFQICPAWSDGSFGWVAA